MQMIELIEILLLLFSQPQAPILGEATYYHESFAQCKNEYTGEPEKCIMRNGNPYDPSDIYTAATGVYADGTPCVPLGTWVLIYNEKEAHQVQIRDTGMFPCSDLDLSFSAFILLVHDEPERVGRTKIRWGILKE